MAETLRKVIADSLATVGAMSTEEMLAQRQARLRAYGRFKESA